jgi:hypothetical protein
VAVRAERYPRKLSNNYFRLELMNIDFVIPWVDGTDSNWVKKYAKYATASPDPVRFRDSGLLKYWFRMVEANAPWVRRIFLITDGQRPVWLNTCADKLTLVSHSDYIPADALPVFNSSAIEVGIHRIPGISDRFVYFNDDIYIINPVTPLDFFSSDGLPLDVGALHPVAPMSRFNSLPFNDTVALNQHFTKKQILSGNRTKLFSPHYGKKALMSIYTSAWPHILGFDNPHGPASFLKATFDETWEAESDWLSQTQHSRFRSSDDLSIWFMRYWQIAKGNFIPRRPSDISYITYSSSIDEIRESLLAGKKVKFLCINDVPGVSEHDFHEKNLNIEKILNAKYPNKSSFEV